MKRGVNPMYVQLVTPSAFGAERQKRLAEFDKIPASALIYKGEK